MSPARWSSVSPSPTLQVVRVFNEFQHEDYARAGARATHDFSLQEGPLSGPSGPLPHTMEPQLRKFGLPSRLNKGVVELAADHTVRIVGVGRGRGGEGGDWCAWPGLVRSRGPGCWSWVCICWGILFIIRLLIVLPGCST